MSTVDESAIALLKERARELAQPAVAQSRDVSSEHVVFRLEKILFAVPMTGVLEVFTPRQVTPLPGWGRGNAGLTAWRGNLLLIVDIRDLLGVASAPNTNIDRVIVMKSDVVTAGVIVDGIVGIEQIGEDLSTSLPERMSAVGTGVVKGITSKGVIVLDSAQLLQQHV